MNINNNTNLSLFIKRELRKALGTRNNFPVSIVGGNSAPSIKGHGFYYENKSGDKINYPSAYRKAWGKPIYIHSTLRIEVGGDWILDNLTINKLKEIKLRAFK